MYLYFESFNLSGSEGIGLGYDRNDVHQMMQLLHKLYIQRLQSAWEGGRQWLKETERERTDDVLTHDLEGL